MYRLFGTHGFVRAPPARVFDLRLFTVPHLCENLIGLTNVLHQNDQKVRLKDRGVIPGVDAAMLGWARTFLGLESAAGHFAWIRNSAKAAAARNELHDHPIMGDTPIMENLKSDSYLIVQTLMDNFPTMLAPFCSSEIAVELRKLLCRDIFIRSDANAVEDLYWIDYQPDPLVSWATLALREMEKAEKKPDHKISAATLAKEKAYAQAVAAADEDGQILHRSMHVVAQTFPTEKKEVKHALQKINKRTKRAMERLGEVQVGAFLSSKKYP